MTDHTHSKPTYLMVQIKAKDFNETMQRYGQAAIACVMQFGGEILAGTPTPEVLEGSWDANWAAILRFPNKEMAQTWYHSPEYQPLKELRINELTEYGQVLMIEGM
jgi:uncharacterized protein (DUF1330 family)